MLGGRTTASWFRLLTISHAWVTYGQLHLSFKKGKMTPMLPWLKGKYFHFYEWLTTLTFLFLSLPENTAATQHDVRVQTKSGTQQSVWLSHTFIHNHVQIVLRWYKAVLRLQCSPSSCLYCIKKKEIPAWSRVKRYFGKYKLCVKKANRRLEWCDVGGAGGRGGMEGGGGQRRHFEALILKRRE